MVWSYHSILIITFTLVEKIFEQLPAIFVRQIFTISEEMQIKYWKVGNLRKIAVTQRHYRTRWPPPMLLMTFSIVFAVTTTRSNNIDARIVHCGVADLRPTGKTQRKNKLRHRLHPSKRPYSYAIRSPTMTKTSHTVQRTRKMHCQMHSFQLSQCLFS